MKKILLLVTVLVVSGCVHSPKQMEIAEIDDGQFQISAISEGHWSGDFLTAELLKNAEDFCIQKNQKFERMSVKKEDERRFSYSNSTVVFRCIPQ